MPRAKASSRVDRRALSLSRLDGRSLSRLRRRHLPEYFQQSRRMDHRAARRGEKRQCARAARVGIRQHHRRAAARRHRHLRRQRTSIIVDSEDEARKAVRDLVDKGVDGIKLFERLKPQVAKAAVDEAHKLGRPVFGHSLDIFTAAANGYQSVEHSWSVVYTSIQDPKKKHDLDIGRMLGKVDTDECTLRWNRRCSTRSSK